MRVTADGYSFHGLFRLRDSFLGTSSRGEDMLRNEERRKYDTYRSGSRSGNGSPDDRVRHMILACWRSWILEILIINWTLF